MILIIGEIMDIKDYKKEGICSYCNKLKLTSFCFYFNPSGNWASEGKYLTFCACDDCKKILDNNEEENKKFIKLLQEENKKEIDKRKRYRVKTTDEKNLLLDF